MLAVAALLLANTAVELPRLDDAGKRSLASASHLIVVTTPTWDAPDAELALWVRNESGWRRALGPFDAVVGARGLSWGRGVSRPPENASRVKQEGDRTAPAGLFRLGRVIGYAPEAPSGTTLPYQRATHDLRCVDDPASVFYNRITLQTADADWTSSELMRRDDHLYERLVLIDHNHLLGDRKPIPKAGSCIFLHVWRKPGKPTIGCTALALADLERLLAALPSAEDVLLVQLPRVEHDAAVVAGWLPD